jgi:hypothetical protein
MTTMSVDARTVNYDYRTWPLWSQILLPLGCLTLWIPLYFFVQLITESSCCTRSKPTAADLESQQAQQRGTALERRPAEQANNIAIAI